MWESACCKSAALGSIKLWKENKEVVIFTGKQGELINVGLEGYRVVYRLNMTSDQTAGV